MKSRVFITLALSLLMTAAYAQKIDQRLTSLVEQASARRAQGKSPIDMEAVSRQISVKFNADGTVKSMSAIATLNEGAACPTARLEQMGIKVRFVLGDMVALTIPAERLQSLEQIEEFSYVEADEMTRGMNQEARKATNVEKVNSQAVAIAQGLPQAYTGKGVVLGIIDYGIDYNHAAFRDADGKTRIVKLIDYSMSDVAMEYSGDDEISSLTTDIQENTHGTHTSAIAGGSDTGNGLQGMAPETDIVICSLGKYKSKGNIVESISKIFSYATSVGKPAVVSISLGNIIGLHDGSDVMAKGIKELTANGTKPGRAVVSSSANSAARNQSIIKTFASEDEELKTVLGAFTYPTNESPSEAVSYNFEWYMYADDYQDFYPTLKLVNIYTGELIDLGNHVTDSHGDIIDFKLNKLNVKRVNGENAVAYNFIFNSTRIDNAAYRFALIVKPGHAGQTVKMMCDGDTNSEPCFSAPATDSYNFFDHGYTPGWGDFAFNTNICDESVISVGSYMSRNIWTNYQGKGYYYLESTLTGKKQEIGEISDFSSYGVADNGVKCPTVIAPGHGLISAANSYSTEFFKAKQPGVPNDAKDLNRLCASVNKNERDNWYCMLDGTSMACPVVSGIVALWMQAKPTLTVSEIKEIFKSTCTNDEFTTNVLKIPSMNTLQAGMGKVDCLAGLKQILGATGIETVSAGGSREATPATMYSVNAPVYNMMGQQVDKSHKGLVIYKGRKYYNK